MKLASHKTLWLGAIFAFMLDQISKTFSLLYLPFDQEIILNRYISFHRIFNEDTIMLSYSLPFGITVEAFRIYWLMHALLLAIGIFWVTSKGPLKNGGWIAEFSKVGLFLILSSIWGNSFDRIFRKNGVIDFIRINYSTESIPILNIADIMIYLGELNLIIAWTILLYQIIYFKYYKKDLLLIK